MFYDVDDDDIDDDDDGYNDNHDDMDDDDNGCNDSVMLMTMTLTSMTMTTMTCLYDAGDALDQETRSKEQHEDSDLQRPRLPQAARTVR